MIEGSIVAFCQYKSYSTSFKTEAIGSLFSVVGTKYHQVT